MKSILYTLSFLLLAAGLQAQITIGADAVPKPGDKWKQLLFEMQADPGPAGENITWDFSDWPTSSSFALTFNYVDPSTFPNSSQFPDATLGATIEFEGFGYSGEGYYRSDNTCFELLGTANDGTIETYDDPYKPFVFPLNYNDSYSDEYSATGGFAPQSGHLEVSIDAYGTLILPNGTFENVLRIKQVDTSRDSFVAGGVAFVDVITETKYGWVSKDNILALAEIDIEAGKSLTYINGQLTEEEELETEYFLAYNPDAGPVTAAEELKEQARFQVYPNPAQDQVVLDIPAISGPLHLSIYDATGRLYRQERLDVFSASPIVDVSDLAAGLYTFQIQTKAWSQSQKISMQR